MSCEPGEMEVETWVLVVLSEGFLDGVECLPSVFQLQDFLAVWPEKARKEHGWRIQRGALSKQVSFDSFSRKKCQRVAR